MRTNIVRRRAARRRRSLHPINLSGGVQLQLHDYPATVVRELLVNALVHRDYEFEGEVELEHTPERLVISSPGGLVFGVTPQNILSHPSTPRNRLLLETVTALQIAERTGQGIDRAYRDLLRIGKQPPRFDDDGTRVTASVAGGIGNDAFARYVNAELDPKLAADLEILYALSYLREHRSLNGDMLALGIQRSPAEAQQTLERMTDAELVEPSRRTARKVFPNYALAPSVLAALGRAVVYHRRDADGIDQKIVEHVTEYGYITNQTLRRLFDLGVYPARDLLRHLQERGVLRKLDEKGGGPGIRYGPGPDFPAHRGRRVAKPEG
jgi:ATP-dependent DNA helicase RecG